MCHAENSSLLKGALSGPRASFPRASTLIPLLALSSSFFVIIHLIFNMGVQLPDLQFTSLEVIPERISTVRKSFLENKTRDVEFRLVQLRKLYWA
jgi:hypothetical protein